MPPPNDLVNLLWVIILVLCGVIATIAGVAWAKIQSLHTIIVAGSTEQVAFARSKEEAVQKQVATLLALVDSQQEDKLKIVGVLNEQREILEHISTRLPNRGGRGG